MNLRKDHYRAYLTLGFHLNWFFELTSSFPPVAKYYFLRAVSSLKLKIIYFERRQSLKNLLLGKKNLLFAKVRTNLVVERKKVSLKYYGYLVGCKRFSPSYLNLCSFSLQLLHFPQVLFYLNWLFDNKFFLLKKKQNFFNYNPERWITRLVGRWRTQQTARRHVNCRTHEHRHFERTLRLSGHVR